MHDMTRRELLLSLPAAAVARHVFAQAGNPAIRVSVQGYNTRADIDRVLEAIATLLPQVRTS